MLKREVRMHSGDLEVSWRLSALLRGVFRPTKEKRSMAIRAEQGRKREDPNKWFPLGMSSQNLLLGPVAPHSVLSTS